MIPDKKWRLWLLRLILVLWGLQVLWLIWHFGPEAGEVAGRAARQTGGAAIRQEDPLFRWSTALKSVIPENATYVFLDDYTAGKEIEFRYYMTPRRHILMSPKAPASFLFYTLHQEKASFLLLRKPAQSPGHGYQAALRCDAFRLVNIPGPGEAFKVDSKLLHWGFYD